MISAYSCIFYSEEAAPKWLGKTVPTRKKTEKSADVRIGPYTMDEWMYIVQVQLFRIILLVIVFQTVHLDQFQIMSWFTLR